ncbi:MAG: thymidylate kinase [Candidatus Sulfotelmatobacter sp.]|jgi:thymidylate kinase
MALDRIEVQATATRPFIITFSGIDGAGKTTQIESLSSCLHQQGLRVVRLSFWDHVAVWSRMRAGVGHRTLDSIHADPMTARTFAPKNNKHIRKWYLSAARAGLYVLDVDRLQRLLASQAIRNSDVVIFDRYIYDQVANIYSPSIAARSYAKMLLRRTPAPDLAFVLDASPTAAFARKPEYPLEFVHQNRQNFLRLRELVPQLIVISDAGVEDVKSEISSHIRRSRLVQNPSSQEKTGTPVSAVVGQKTSCRV